jgi:hypothetical protein
LRNDVLAQGKLSLLMDFWLIDYRQSG